MNSNNIRNNNSNMSGGENTISNGMDTFYKKANISQNNLSMFENWKLANSILNFNFLKTNNGNSNGGGPMNSTLNNNKVAKSLKPHICNICQKRFAR